LRDAAKQNVCGISFFAENPCGTVNFTLKFSINLQFGIDKGAANV